MFVLRYRCTQIFKCRCPHFLTCNILFSQLTANQCGRIQNAPGCAHVQMYCVHCTTQSPTCSRPRPEPFPTNPIPLKSTPFVYCTPPLGTHQNIGIDLFYDCTTHDDCKLLVPQYRLDRPWTPPQWFWFHGGTR